MNPYATYKQQATPSWTRIDMLLTLFDGGVERCEQALAALERQDKRAAKNLLVKSRLIVLGLASGIIPDGDPVTTTMLRLYEYAQHALGQGSVEDVQGALNVLRILREGFQKIRAEAVDLERRGLIPPINNTSTLRALA
ncbi:MAG TPA: flagellar export chaperone FliS [Gemmataceae bacterium]|nr:flagellar export chaperone FliS [Gemmataceae bacterium]